MQELLWPERLARNEVLIHAGNIVKVTIPSICVLPSVFIFIIHFRVLHTLAHCIKYLARRLFIRELLMFGVMNKGHTFIMNVMYVMNINNNTLPLYLLS